MFRYKGFSSAAFGDDVQRLESCVNEWMVQQQPRIRMVAQSPHGDHFVLSFVYEDSTDSGHQLATQIAVPEVFERTMEDTALDPQELDPDADLENEVEVDFDDIRLPEAELPY